MRKTLQKLCAFTALFVLSTMSGWAQYTGSVSAKYTLDYSTTAIPFKLSEVATTLGTDSATFTDLIDTYLSTEDKTTTALTFDLVYNGTTYTGSDHSEGGGGWYMNADGDLSGWRVEGGIWFATFGASDNLSYDSDVDEFYICCGQNGGGSTGDIVPPVDGVTCKASLQLTYNGKTATFDITYIIRPKSIKPTTDMKYSSLTIAETINHTVSQPQTKSNKVLADTIVVEGLASTLGIDAAELADDLDAHLFVRHYDVESGDPYLKDSIKSDFSGDSSNGYVWSQRTKSEAQTTLLDSCYSGAIDADAVTVFRTQDITYSNDTIFMNVGQNSGNAEKDHTYTGTILICNTEGKAVEVNVNLAVTESEALPFTEMTCAGSYTSKSTILPGSSAEITVTIPQDIVAEIEEKTGVINGDAYFYVYSDSTCKDITDKTTANNGGSWYGLDGIQADYYDADAAMYVQPVTYGNYASFVVGQYIKKAIQDGDSVTSAVLVVGDNSYYILNFCLKAKSTVGERENWHIVATDEYDVYCVPSQASSWLQTLDDGSAYIIRLDSARIYANLGVTSIGATDLYAWKTNGYSEIWHADSLTNSYTCDPNPGFWMSKDGMTSQTYGSESTIGMNLATDTMTIAWYLYPTISNVNTDSVYNPEYFLVNSENGNVYKMTFHIHFVETTADRIPQVLPATEVGKETVNLVLSEEKLEYDGTYKFDAADFDLSKAYTALGITVDDLASAEWQVKKNASGSLTVPTDGFEGAEICSFDSAGIYTVEPEDIAFSLGVETDPEVALYVTVNGEVTESTLYTTKIALVYDQKAYVFNLVIGSETATGINSVSDVKENGVKAIYTLSGQRVNHASKGLYIINGKKVLVK